MKKIVSGDELRSKMEVSINMLCDTVKTTLGPIGSNVIINSSLTPFITNDGVTIANNIDSEDDTIRTILDIAKESTINTNDKVGDGTTTTLVLLQGIFNEGLKQIDNGKKRILLKNELDESVNTVIDEISKRSRKPTDKELLSIATSSANDKEIGKIVYDVFKKIKDKNSISLIEGEKTKVNYLKGYIVDTVLASPYFLDKKELELYNPYVLLSDNEIYDIESISNILNYTKDKSLIIYAPSYSDILVNQVLSLVINEDYKIILFQIPEYGTRGIDILKDIETITLGKICHEVYNIKSLGIIRKIKVSKECTTLEFSNNDMIRNRVLELKRELKNELDEYEIDFYKMQISMLKNKKAEIIVGGSSKVERREKLMRFEDSLSSISTAYDGIVVGSGLTLYEISEKLDNAILCNALKLPLKQIIENSGLDSSIIDKIINSNFKKIYNVSTLDYEDISNTSVIDPTMVVINSVLNAVSVAKMLLTTTSLVINENEVKNYDNL